MKFKIMYYGVSHESYLYMAKKFCSEKAANKALLAYFNRITDSPWRINLIKANLKIERDYEDT
jgi:hypothetical protein